MAILIHDKGRIIRKVMWGKKQNKITVKKFVQTKTQKK